MSQQKIVLITGGTGEIGTAIAKQLHATYSCVIALDIIELNQGKQWQSQLQKEEYPNIHFVSMDVTNFQQCQEVIGDLVQTFGRIDALINNAGITRDAVFTKMTKAQWDTVLSVNLDGMFNVSKPVVEQMCQQNFGRILNIASVNGEKGQFSQTNYSASKAGIYGFTKSLAQELMSKNITVNSLSPGYVNTHLMKGIRADILAAIIEQIPAKRLAEPEEIAWVVEFLISDKNTYMTGANISVNGGLFMH